MNQMIKHMQNQIGCIDTQTRITGDLTKKTVYIKGNPNHVQSQLQRISNLSPDQKLAIKECTIYIDGQMIKEEDWNCFFITVCLAVCCLFPILCMLCSWWQKKVAPGFRVPTSTYSNLNIIFELPSLQRASIYVLDNTFNKQKAEVIAKSLSKSTVKDFVFRNSAGTYNYDENQWSGFNKHMKLIKQLPITSDIRWGQKTVK